MRKTMQTSIHGAGLALLLALMGVLGAQEYGDAPASYGELSVWGGYAGAGTPCLGLTADNDPAGPRGYDWVSDSDDGVVGTPSWDSWSDTNSISVRVSYGGHLIMWVDANDNGTFEADERYEYSPGWVNDGVFTFDNIRIKATQRFALNGLDKVGVRITIQDPMGGNPTYNTDGYFWFGEIEDWLINVQRPRFAIEQTSLDDAIEGDAYTLELRAVNKSGPFSWTLQSGSLPAGMSLVQQGDHFCLSGTPAIGTGDGRPSYTFTVSCTGGSDVVQQTYTLAVWAPAVAAPFLDTFSTNTGWKLGGDWARVQAAAFSGTGINHWGSTATEPAEDATPGSTDNMILNDTPGAIVGDVWKVKFATSPYIDCSGLSHVSLRLRRWHALGNWDHARIMVSNDGINWTLLWRPARAPFVPINYYPSADIAWTTVEYDISAYAAGHARVQVRIGLGFVNVGYRDAWGGHGYTGMCLDDFWVGPGDSGATASAYNFDVSSPNTVIPGGGGPALPVMYEQSRHAFSFRVDNQSGEDIIVDRFEVGVSLDAPFGSNPATVELYEPSYGWNSWLPTGTWTLNNPLTQIPDNTTGLQLTGEFDSVGIPYQWLQACRAQLVIHGRLAGSGQGVRLVVNAGLAFYPGPQPGLQVWDAPAGSSGANIIANGDAAAGLRDFGSRTVGTTSGHTYIICKSTTSNSFTVSPPQLTGPDASQFIITLPPTWNPTPHQGQNDVWFTVRFSPTSVGLKTATVTFAHSAPNTGTPFTFEVTGVGVTNAPALHLIDNHTGNPVSNNSPAIGGLNFGQHDFNAGALTRRFDIENQGGATLTVSLPMLTGDPAFTLDTSSTATSIAPGNSTSFFVHFDPAAAGNYGAAVSFTHNDSGAGSSFSFNVAGQGVLNAPRIRITLGSPTGSTIVNGAVAAGPTDFGPQDVHTGAAAPLEVFIHNDGWQDLVLMNYPTFQGGSVGDFLIDIGGTSMTVAGQSYTSFMVWFDPLAKGPKATTARIEHNDGSTGNLFQFQLAGLGVDPNGVVINPVSPLTAGKIGVAYSFQFSATGGNPGYTWTKVSGSLPAGLTLHADGTLDGTPTGNHGLFRFRVRATDSLNGTDELQVELPIAPPIGHLAKDPANNPAGCNVQHGSQAWVALLLLLTMSAAVRRRKA